MKGHWVSTVELGAQSMDDHVLALSKRGHTAEDTVGAARLLRRYGFKVGIQLMPGLPIRVATPMIDLDVGLDSKPGSIGTVRRGFAEV